MKSGRSRVEGKLTVVTGGLGSGKTTLVAEWAQKHLLRGGVVVSNIEFDRERIRDWMLSEGFEMDDSRLVQVQDDSSVWTNAVRGTSEMVAMLICDEAHLKHDSRDWAKTPREQMVFNTMVRKLKIHVVYVTQDQNNLDKRFRSLKNERWSCRNMRQLRWGPFGCPLDVFIRTPYHCEPNSPDIRMQPEVVWRPLSHGFFKTDHLVDEAEAMFAGLRVSSLEPLKRVARVKPAVDWLPWLCGLVAFGVVIL